MARNVQEWLKKLGTLTRDDAFLSDEVSNTHRDMYCTAIRAFHAQGKMARTEPLRYLIRHTAYHTLDHTWEMEDRGRHCNTSMSEKDCFLTQSGPRVRGPHRCGRQGLRARRRYAAGLRRAAQERAA